MGATIGPADGSGCWLVDGTEGVGDKVGLAPGLLEPVMTEGIREI